MNYKVIYQEGAREPLQYSYADPLEAVRKFKTLAMETAEWLVITEKQLTVEIKLTEEIPGGARVVSRRITITASSN
jgi:hypothetical protein